MEEKFDVTFGPKIISFSQAADSRKTVIGSDWAGDEGRWSTCGHTATG